MACLLQKTKKSNLTLKRLAIKVQELYDMFIVKKQKQNKLDIAEIGNKSPRTI